MLFINKKTKPVKAHLPILDIFYIKRCLHRLGGPVRQSRSKLQDIAFQLPNQLSKRGLCDLLRQSLSLFFVGSSLLVLCSIQLVPAGNKIKEPATNKKKTVKDGKVWSTWIWLIMGPQWIWPSPEKLWSSESSCHDSKLTLSKKKPEKNASRLKAPTAFKFAGGTCVVTIVNISLSKPPRRKVLRSVATAPG